MKNNKDKNLKRHWQKRVMPCSLTQNKNKKQQQQQEEVEEQMEKENQDC